MKTKLITRMAIWSLLFATIVLSSCSGRSKKASSEAPAKITVFAAASLTNVLSELIDSFEIAENVKVITNMASSGTLARQIEQGGTPEVFISASKKWADYVDSLGFIQQPLKDKIAQNDLVFVAPKESELETFTVDSTLDVASMLKDGRLSIGNPAHVPAGKYAKQALLYYGWYDQLADRYLPAKDVRSALMVVEMGEAPLGIVYRTDAEESSKVRIVGTFPDHSHKPIVYIACVLKDNDRSKAFYKYIKSEASAPIWAKYGFNQ
ncbi:molybdate ABC transporter substrate-binding protein [Mangrovibacterium marinum]|uniref:Molybdate transport system substrate-binding protein n=1 Tax=Mangrovibacterium marinum TaxID=1639118 RepID=A0A2T5BUE7_9BACT|nr:molybdate ABC transporter substrate-binding protein [Mangrovibacterium marinum]PTN03153.1 molybdate transport system substrate-binding protein [Mangrovibacterium marinum]